MQRPLRVAVIGCGQISKELHVPDYATCPDADLVALADPVTTNALALIERWAPHARAYADYAEMLANENLDAVTVTVPNRLHAEVAIAALNAGCHVLVEKPMATSSAEAQRMIEAATASGKLLIVNQSQRLYAVHRKAKEVIDSGIMGKILLVTAMFGHEGPEHWSPTGKWFFDKKDARFGAMADLGVHKADLVRFLTGKEVRQISAYVGCLEKEGANVEDNFVSCLTFDDGTLGTLTASWTTKGMDANYTILHCAKGTLRISEIPGKPLVANLVDPVCEIVFDVPEQRLAYEGSWGLDVGAHFVRAIRGEEAPYCTALEGKRSLEVILAAEQSAQSGRSITIE